MAHGTPDWGVTAGQATVYQLTDLAELAARLGSPITHDRRGDVIFWDDFEWSLNKWETDLAGTGAAAAISTVRARNGRCSALLTAGADGSAYAAIEHGQPLPSNSALGVELSVALPGLSDSLRVQYQVRLGGRILSPEIQVDLAGGRLLYIDAASAEVVLASGSAFSLGNVPFDILKLVVDPVAEEYVRVIANEVTYNLAGIAAPASASVARGYTSTIITNQGLGGSNPLLYVDDVILTQNEPV